MSTFPDKIIIAIDGHSSCGKSTFAKAIASKMNYIYIDSGAMYRAFTLACMEQGIIKGDRVEEEQLDELLGNIDISFKKVPGSPVPETFLNGKNVEDKIRSIEVSNHVSLISKFGKVREKMVALQRETARDMGVVMDGRDIGTVVFPGADIKIFMTADTSIRAERRYRELRSNGVDADFNEVRKNIIERDRLDETREVSPLKKAPGAIVLDNSYMTPEEQMDWFENILAKLNISK
ncbi:MAG: (d)CMP kinase [Bacteroidales bacterium]